MYLQETSSTDFMLEFFSMSRLLVWYSQKAEYSYGIYVENNKFGLPNHFFSYADYKNTHRHIHINPKVGSILYTYI